VLARALTQVIAAVGGNPTSISYFDFAYPGANKISVINAPNNYDLLEVQIPNGFQVFEAAETGAYTSGDVIGVENVTPSIQIGQFQEWYGALIVVYNVQSSARIVARNADSLWHSSLGRPDFKSGTGATPTPVPTATPQPSPTPGEPTPPTATPTPTAEALPRAQGACDLTGEELRFTAADGFISAGEPVTINLSRSQTIITHFSANAFVSPGGEIRIAYNPNDEIAE
jgi:hypothetical protein